jgi:hypothetical protein
VWNRITAISWHRLSVHGRSTAVLACRGFDPECGTLRRDAQTCVDRSAVQRFVIPSESQ